MQYWFVDCFFAFNSANDRGGAVEMRDMPLKCTNTIFLHNTIVNFGAAIACNLRYTAVYDFCVFAKNRMTGCATSGGGSIYTALNLTTSRLNISNTLFYDNLIVFGCSYSMFCTYFFLR
jgi:hypothetical protein